MFRCDRLTWAAGKLAGQEALLGCGLLVGALVAGLVGQLADPTFEATTWIWLVRTSFRAWIYGSAYLGIFLGLSQVSRSALGAFALGLFALIGITVARSILTSDFANARIPLLRYLALLFPAEHSDRLWSPHWGAYLSAALALFGIGALGFGAGHAVFRGRDA